MFLKNCHAQHNYLEANYYQIDFKNFIKLFGASSMYFIGNITSRFFLFCFILNIKTLKYEHFSILAYFGVFQKDVTLTYNEVNHYQNDFKKFMKFFSAALMYFTSNITCRFFLFCSIFIIETIKCEHFSILAYFGVFQKNVTFNIY